ncbi:MAG: STAS domain-containing protein [Cycloclasticus sp.]
MAINITEQSDTLTHISIADEMTIYTVLEQKNTLLAQLKPDQQLQLDLSAVPEIDSAGMQLLIHLKKKAKELDNEFSLTNHSQAVVEVIGLFNLTSFFGDPIVITADRSES